MCGEDVRWRQAAQPYGEEESLSGAGLEELLPLVCVAHGEGDGVDGVLELSRDGAGPPVQLEAKQHGVTQRKRLILRFVQRRDV